MSAIAPAIQYLRVSLAARYARARAEDASRGASVVEWVGIMAGVVVIIVSVAAWIVPALEDKAKQTCTSINNSGSAGTAKCS